MEVFKYNSSLSVDSFRLNIPSDIVDEFGKFKFPLESTSLVSESPEGISKKSLGKQQSVSFVLGRRYDIRLSIFILSMIEMRFTKRTTLLNLIFTSGKINSLKRIKYVD